MARSVTPTFTTETRLVTDGVKFTQYRVRLVGTTPLMQFVPFGTLTTVFPSVMPGTYLATVELSNGDGTAIGPAASSASFEVPSDDAMLDVPVSVTVAVGAM